MTSVPEKSQPPLRFWRTIYELILPSRGLILTGSACSLIVGTAVAFQPLMVKFIIDNGLGRKDASPSERLIWSLLFVGIYLVLSIFRMSLWWVGNSRFVKGIEQFLFELRYRLFRHVQGLCFRFHDRVSSGELLNYIMGSPVTSLRTFLQQAAMTMPFQVVSWVVAFAALASFDIVMTGIVALTALIVIIVNHRSRKVVRDLTADFMKTESQVSRYAADVFRGCRAIKLHAAELTVTGTFEDHLSSIRQQSMALVLRQQLEHFKPEGIQYFGIATIYIAGIYSCIYRGLTIGEFFAFVASVNTLMTPLMTMMQLNLVRSNAEAGLERITRVMQTGSSTPDPDPKSCVSFTLTYQKAEETNLPCFEFDHVEFSYDEREPLFNELSCRIPRGQSVALVGTSGAGKSTFVNLLLRFYDVQRGAILINGHDIRDYELAELRSNFGVVPQDPFLFQATIQDNVRLACPHATDDDIRRAMEIAHVNEFVEKLPKGWNTMVGEGGYGLSGGQRQRVAIARAVLAKPLFFVFDEATSALDNTSEHQIQETMRGLMKDSTTIVIAHRLSTIRDVDRVLVFEKGAIVQDGKYEKLAQTEGPFANLLHSASPVDSLPE